MSQAELLIEQDGAVRTIALNRPETRNGLTPSLCAALGQAVEEASGDDSVRCVVLTGRGDSFCSGADLSAAMATLAERSHGDVIRDDFHRVIRGLAECPKPVIASIRGGAVGFGLDIALACDLRIASRQSKLGAVFTRIGLVPDGGSSFFLARLVGLARALEIVLLAETFDGERAAEIGIVSRVVDDDLLDEETAALAQRLAAGPPLAYRLAKRNILDGLAGSLDDALAREVAAQVQCLASADSMEGVQAFLQKRKPTFTGR
ncbi:MAG: 2-(1,2-epoxy-1,2-dihydrophenyl)acetyl-CoA isomerase [Myxococcota bacterium]|jgi:2-(1,2-epoxy-1,2-dihydrophenyl)acetyl-CoA isomerase